MVNLEANLKISDLESHVEVKDMANNNSIDAFKECKGIHSDCRTLHRGDIVTYDFGDYCGSIQGGYRPAVVLQDSDMNDSSPVVFIVPITTIHKKSEMLAHIVLGRRFGLKRGSVVLYEQVRAVNKGSLGNYIGRIDDLKVMNQIDQGLCEALGIKSLKATANSSSGKASAEERTDLSLTNVMLFIFILYVVISIAIVVSMLWPNTIAIVTYVTSTITNAFAAILSSDFCRRKP